MMRRSTVILLSVLLTGVAGCSSRPTETHSYLLRPGAGGAPAAGATVVRLTRVEVAPYLDQQGIVLELSGNEIQAARYNRWSEPLGHAIRRYLQVAISARSGLAVEVEPFDSGAEAAALEVMVHQLHGGRDGNVRLIAEWQAQTTDNPPRRLHREFSTSGRIGSDGYAALVAEHEVLLDALADDVAAGLAELLDGSR